MSLFKVKLLTIPVAVFSALLSLSATPAEAAPPPGMRWSDAVGLTSPRHATHSTTFAPAISSPLFSSYIPATVTPAVENPASTGATISVRGPDGVARTYPVEGPVVQQGAPTYIAVQGSDGIVRTYQVVGEQPAAPVVTHPCR